VSQEFKQCGVIVW